MESIKEEPKDFGARGTTLSDIEQYPHAVGVGALIERDAENQSDSDTMTLGETEEQSPTHNMTLNELEDYSDVLGSGDLIPRDAEAQSEASTVILGDFEKHPDTPGAHAPELSLSVKNSPDEDSDEENQFALTPEPFTTPRGTTSSRSFSIIGSPHTQEQSLSPRRFENCMACQEGTREYFFGYCGSCAFQAGRWRLCDMCLRCLPSVGWRGFCLDCIPMTPGEKNYIWPVGTQSYKEIMGEPRLHTCLRCGNEKVFEKTCEVCWGPQPQEHNGDIIHESTGGLDTD